MSARIDDLDAELSAAERSRIELPPPGSPDIEIARAVPPLPILALAQQRLGLPGNALVPFGHYKAKLALEHLATLADEPRGRLVLVTAITPTPGGEGKTTTSIGLSDGLNRLGVNATVCLREPSLGPCFGMKGGAAGGGRAQVIPMEDINLHFNGDCTVCALKMQGGVARDKLSTPDVAAVRDGAANLFRHIRNLQQFGLSPLVAINRFPSDSDDEIDAIQSISRDLDADAVTATHWAEGGEGSIELAQAVLERLGDAPPQIEFLYPDDMPLADKIRTVATRMYGAADISLAPAAARQLHEFEQLGFGHLPVCIAKTQFSFSADPTVKGAPSGHVLPVREARLSAGAGFVVAVCGDIMTMPGLPRRPSALDMGFDDDGNIVGLS